MTPAALTAARVALGLTQGQLAAALGVGRKTVNRWECGTCRIPPMVGLALETLRIQREAN